MATKVSLLQKAGVGNSTRRKASAKDESNKCSGCQTFFMRGQRIEWTPTGIPVHKYVCWNRYLGALAAYYDLTAVQLVMDLHIPPRTAYRIMRIGREILEGK